MKLFKTLLIAACMGLMLPATVTGCGNKDTAPSVQIVPEEQKSTPMNTDTMQTDVSEPETEQHDSDNTVIPVEEYISGKVKELNADGFLFSRTVLTTDFEGNHTSSVTILDEEDAEKILVKYTPDTKFEHWTIQGGGAGIDKKDASASDITEGLGLEIGGHFEGADLIAELVLIEVYE